MLKLSTQNGAVKIYVAAVEELRKKERQGETQEPSKLIRDISNFGTVSIMNFSHTKC
jgi:hypothetical protein